MKGKHLLTRIRQLFSMAFHLAIASLVFSCRMAHGQSVPPLINYQGRLTDSSGAPLTPGTYGLAFRLWDKQSLNTEQKLIWSREYDVTMVEGGVFNVILGAPSGRPLQDNPGAAVNDLAFAFGEPNRFLGLTISRDSNGPVSNPKELVPRQQLLSAPFAFNALLSQTVAPGAIKSGQLDAGLQLDLLNPPGVISAFGGANVPDGWLLCDGRAVSSIQYSRLFAAIGKGWGAGIPGSTNDFNLPDLRGMFLRGVNAGRTNSFGLFDPDADSRTNGLSNGNFGDKVGSVQLDAFKAHEHPRGSSNLGAAVQPGGFGNPAAVSSTGFAGGSETRPKNAYVNYIIKF